MAKSVDEGVCDEFGRVYDKSKKGEARPYYEGLYIADASLIPTSLGVNPSLTISAVALRAVQEWISTDLPKLPRR
jgi:cholesterol oxidase